ncbi:hypothetical protein D3C72_1905000 [compost metagenome]
MDQAHVLADKFAEPLRSNITGIRDAKGVTPDRHAAQFAVSLRHGNLQRRSPRRLQGQLAVNTIQRRQLAHLWIRALGQEAAIVALYKHPATVAIQPQQAQ